MTENLFTVLLVDDDESVRRSFARILHRSPYRLLTARSVEEATWTMKTRSVDALAVDAGLPGASIAELLEWASAHCPAAVRIVLVEQFDAAAIRAVNEGRAARVFIKPCDEKQLLDALDKASESRMLRDENARLAAAERCNVEAWTRRTEAVRQLHAKILREVREPLEAIRGECSPTEKREPAFGGDAMLRRIDRALEALATLEATVDVLCEEPATPVPANPPDGAGRRSTG